MTSLLPRRYAGKERETKLLGTMDSLREGKKKGKGIKPLESSYDSYDHFLP